MMGPLTKHLRDVNEEAKKSPAFWRCHTHGPAKAGAWGCPECVREMRGELEELRAQKDGAYLERNQCVALVARMAVAMGLPVAVTKTAIEGWSEDWHSCIYIGLPTGQVSWHFHDSQAHLFDGLPRREEAWDGHDTPEKYRRVGEAFRA